MELLLRYNKPAENSVIGWENDSLPLGNGYFGVSVFGGISQERLQINDPTLFTKGKDTYYTSMTGMADLYFDFPHNNVTDYERGLDLNTAKAYVKYKCDGVEYKREYFTSYPARMLVMKFTASKENALNFKILPQVSYISDYQQFEGDGGGRVGEVYTKNDIVYLKGRENWFGIRYECQVRVLYNSGKTIFNGDSITIENSDEVVVLFSESTNYKMLSEIFLEDDPKKKLKDSDPHENVEKIFTNCPKTFKEIEKQHLDDYQELFFREKLELCNETTAKYYTDELLLKAKEEFVPYLEVLYFQYSRYMMISASRKGGIPASLQGVWNVYKQAPWGSGIWHNVNVQMNYWLSFAGNIPETFENYVDYFKAYLPKARQFADEFVKENTPENFETEGENGFVIGTAATPYYITALDRSFSGPGNIGFTAQLFWLYYDYTRKKKILEDATYPALEEASKFLTKSVKKYDDLYLANFSASPEQNCVMRAGASYGSPYNTVGCAYDQQMIADNADNFLKSAQLLGIDNETVAIQKEQYGKYNPVEVGWSGQIKEYSEEKFYGEIGEYCHRHISHLVGLYPGNIINSETPAWIDAARYTLNERGDNSTGWALAHRMCCWARACDGTRVHKLFKILLNEKTNNNLWDMHPPFQIDGNFGAAAALAELLVQSQEEYINILPALPDCWDNGKCEGIAARGGFDVDVTWNDGSATEISVTSKVGGTLKLKYFNISNATVECNGKMVDFVTVDEDKIYFETMSGMKYKISGLTKKEQVKSPYNLSINKDDLKLSWECDDKDVTFNVYRVCDSAPVYDKIAGNVTAKEYQDKFDINKYEVIRYKVTAVKGKNESDGEVVVINHATQLEIDRYENSIILKKPPEGYKPKSNQLIIPEE